LRERARRDHKALPTNSQKGYNMASTKLTDEHLTDYDVLDLTAAELQQLDDIEKINFESILDSWCLTD
jgi:hypothetical protein